MPQVDNLLESLKARPGEAFERWRRARAARTRIAGRWPSMREIVMDTETTGLDPDSGDRLVEIACVELANYIPTGRVWHQYINPQREVPHDAFRVHGLSTQFLADKPLFSDLVDLFLDFVDGGKMIFHNAGFDMKFINAELHPHRARRDPVGAGARHAGAGAPQTSGRAEQPRRAVQALQHRQFGPHQARRPARRRIAGGGLPPAHRRPAAQFRPHRPARRRRGRIGRREHHPVRPEPLAPNLADAEREAHAAFIAELGAAAVWDLYETP